MDMDDVMPQVEWNGMNKGGGACVLFDGSKWVQSNSMDAINQTNEVK
jgi:hypothetical protein